MAKLTAQGYKLLDPSRYVLEVVEAELVDEYGPQLKLRVHFKTLLETGGSRVKVRRSRQVFPHFGRVLIRPGTSARGFEMRSKASRRRRRA